MAKEYLKDFEKIIEKDKTKIQESDLTPKNKELILRFIDEYKVIKGLQPPTIHKHLYQLRLIGLIVDKDLDSVLEDKVEIIKVISTLQSKKIRGGGRLCDSSVYDFKKSLKAFFRWLYGKGKIYPPCVDWINLTKNPSKDRLPESVLTKADILALVSSTKNCRDTGLVYSLWECGQRINGFLALRLKHVTFDNKGCKIAFTRNDKTHEVWIRMVECTSAMASWLNSHPDKDNPDAYLWVTNNGKNRGKKLNYETLVRMFKEVAHKAGIKKPVTPHQFRHSRATFLARYMTDSELKQFFGWCGDSRMPQRYIHLAGRDIEQKVLQINGISTETEVEEENHKPKICSRCRNPNSSLSRWCAFCGNPLDAKTVVEMVRDEQIIDWAMNIVMCNEDKRKKFAELLKS